MASLQAICNSILRKSFDEKIAVSPMKLQKLLYFVYKDYLQKHDTPMFHERFEAWQYGPVLPSIYDEFKNYGPSPIKTFAKDSQGIVYVVSDCATDVIASIDRVWERYKHYNGIELSKITHREQSAWYKAYTNKKAFLDDEAIKNDKTDGD